MENNGIPQTIIPKDLNPGIMPEDIVFRVIQTAEMAEGEATLETNINPEEKKVRFRWELHLAALEGKSLDDIEKVKYTLHPTVQKPERTFYTRGNGYQVKSAGWGVYPVKIEVSMHNGKKITALHMLDFCQGAL